MGAGTLGDAPDVRCNGSHRRQIVDWQIGDMPLCVTPGSEIENRLVMVVSKPLVELSKEDFVYWVHAGFAFPKNWGWGADKRHPLPMPDTIESNEWESGPFIPGEPVHWRARETEAPISKESHTSLASESKTKGIRKKSRPVPMPLIHVRNIRILNNVRHNAFSFARARESVLNECSRN